MNKAEALEVLSHEMNSWRARSYEQLSKLIGAPKCAVEIIGPSGTLYYVTVEVFWDSRPNANVRVLGCVDDGRYRAFVPLSNAFIVSSDGGFVGE